MPVSPEGKLNWENRTLFHGDNLDVMRAMNSNTVDLIATDPPFNKDKDFYVTPDRLKAAGRKVGFHDRWAWDRDVHEEWVDQLTDDHPQLRESIESARFAHSDSMGAYICYMSVRLLEMHRLLKPTGSIYLHCDSTASHYLKAAMDAIFGWRMFRNDITWRRTRGKGLNPSRFVRNCDHILFYSYSTQRTWIQQYEAFEEGYGDDWKEDEHGKWEPENLTGGKAGGPSAYQPFKGIMPASGRAWAPPKREKFPAHLQSLLPHEYETLTQLQKCEALDAADLIYWPKKKGGMPRYKKYLSTLKGRYVSDVIIDIPPISSHAAERTSYPTQKPLPLYQRIIEASSKKGEVVLDPFCGCATTCVAAERLGRQWVGIDIWDGAHDLVLERMERETHGLYKGHFHYRTDVPDRTDEQEVATSKLTVIHIEPKELWQRLNHRQMKDKLVQWQLGMYDLVVCAGCGRALESEYLQLDHVQPRSDGGSNFIDNRILICGPCNRTKGHTLTLSGLYRANKKSEWMKDFTAAKQARIAALNGARKMINESRRMSSQ